MRAFLLILSLIWVPIGVMVILYTGQARNFFRRLYAKANIRLLAAIPFVIGLLVLVGAFSEAEMFRLLLFLGLLGVAKGIYLTLGPLSQIKNLQQWWLDRASETAMSIRSVQASKKRKPSRLSGALAWRLALGVGGSPARRLPFTRRSPCSDSSKPEQSKVLLVLRLGRS